MEAGALLDYAASLQKDSILISDLDALETFDDAYLKKVRSKAYDLGLQIHLGTWSICPTSRTFKNKWAQRRNTSRWRFGSRMHSFTRDPGRSGLRRRSED